MNFEEEKNCDFTAMFFFLMCFIKGTITPAYRHTGGVSFGGGGGAEVSCANILFDCLHENQVVLPEFMGRTPMITHVHVHL